MQGRIQQFDIQQGQGIIHGEDGQQYIFITQEWRQAQIPMPGDNVVFSIDNQGYAHQVMTAPAPNAYQTLPPMPTMGANKLPMTTTWSEEEDYGFFDWVKKCLNNYANFSGRARRKEYWYFYLFFILVYVLALIVDAALGMDSVVAGIASLALLVPNFAVGARRLHDINKSGWWLLMSLIPIANIVLLVWMASDTKPQSNQWGAPARQM